MAFDCTTDKYASLYARWLKNPGDLLDFGGYDPKEHNLLDLCGGSGIVSQEAIRRGADTVTLLDLNPRWTHPRLTTIKGRVEDLDEGPYRGRTWNFIVCRQALGYLDLVKAAVALTNVTSPGALFVCNNFVQPKWSLHPYRFQGKWFLEGSGYFGRTVFHLQAMLGGYDTTIFSWYTPDEVEGLFVGSQAWELVTRKTTEKSVKFCFRRT